MKQSEQHHDAQIGRLFDDFAESLPEQTRLSSRAEKVGFAPRGKQRGWIAAVVCCAAVLIAVLIVPLLSNQISGMDGNNQTAALGSADVYTLSQVQRRRLSPTASETSDSQSESVASDESSFAAAMREQTEYSVTYEKYYAFYFTSTDELAFIKAVLGVETDYGIVEIEAIAEAQDYVEQSREKIYRNVLEGTDGGKNVFSENDGNGEFVTKAYFNQSGYNFYLTALCNPQNSDDAEKIIEFILQNWGQIQSWACLDGEVLQICL